MCQKSELIDTLWNVNLAIPKPFLSLVDELIDTLWNVNVKGVTCDVTDFMN